MQSQGFSVPGYSMMSQQPKPKPRVPVKKIALAVAAVIAIAAAYTVFFGGHVDASITITDTENRPVSIDSARIMQGGREIAVLSSNPGTARLKEGSYTMIVDAEEYEGAFAEFSVSASEPSVKVGVEKPFMASVQSVSPKQASRVFAGQTIEFEVRVKNSGSEDLSLELYAEAPKEAKATVSPGVLSAKKGSEATATLMVSIPNEYEARDERNGDNLSVFVGIKGKGKSSGKSIEVTAFSGASISLSPSPLRIGKAKAGGDPVQKSITARNTERFGIDSPVEFSVAVANSENPPVDVASWFTFTPRLNSIEAGESKRIILEFRVPASAARDNVSGTITASTVAGETTISFTAEIEEADTVISTPRLTGISSKNTLSKEDGSYSKRNGFLEIENDSGFEIHGMRVSSDCESTWVYIKEPNVELLGVDDTKNVAITVSAPSSASGEEKACKIITAYPNPLDETEDIEREVEFYISVP